MKGYWRLVKCTCMSMGHFHRRLAFKIVIGSENTHPQYSTFQQMAWMKTSREEEETSTNLPSLLLPEWKHQLLLLWLSVNTGFKLLVPFKADYMPTTLHTYSVTDWDCWASWIEQVATWFSVSPACEEMPLGYSSTVVYITYQPPWPTLYNRLITPGFS